AANKGVQAGSGARRGDGAVLAQGLRGDLDARPVGWHGHRARQLLRHLRRQTRPLPRGPRPLRGGADRLGRRGAGGVRHERHRGGLPAVDRGSRRVRAEEGMPAGQQRRRARATRSGGGREDLALRPAHRRGLYGCPRPRAGVGGDPRRRRPQSPRPFPREQPAWAARARQGGVGPPDARRRRPRRPRSPAL
ncbi:MAG: Transcriptional regulator, AcrR family, partial [uncultured Rubrobacteraceae bacterium]